MIEYKVETLDECLEEVKPLLEEHYELVAMYKDRVELLPDYTRYYDMEKVNMLHIVTARDEGKLIGYFISVVSPHMHYMSTKYAVNDIVFIEEAYRKTKVGLDMFKFTEEALKADGVDVIVIHMKTSLPFDSLCEGLGYDYAERNYSKYIGE